MEEIINKIELSGIITLNLMKYKPENDDFITFDIVPFLLHDYLLQEKVFREEMMKTDWAAYKNKEVIIHCSNDAIVPYWAYVLISSLLQPHAAIVIYTEQQDHHYQIWLERVKRIDYALFKDKKVVLKANSDVPPAIYVAATKTLMEHVQSLMWGEAGTPKMIFKKKTTL